MVNLVCRAKLNKEIAHELHLSEGTIKEYLNRIFRKIGVSNRTELAIWALTTNEGGIAMMNLSVAVASLADVSSPAAYSERLSPV